jgi:hypothetical protein
VLNLGGKKNRERLFQGENFQLIAVRGRTQIWLRNPNWVPVLGARSVSCGRADAALPSLGELELDSVRTAATMTEHCNTSENLMVLAAHRALSLQLFHNGRFV